jgi:hypothetical protein
VLPTKAGNPGDDGDTGAANSGGVLPHTGAWGLVTASAIALGLLISGVLLLMITRRNPAWLGGAARRH